MNYPNSSTRLYYLASPYSASTDEQMQHNYELITKLGAIITELYGYALIMPITTSHQMRKFNPNLGTSWEFWQRVDLNYLAHCDELIVVTMPGWKESIGVTAEIAFATQREIPITYLDPIDLLQEWSLNNAVH